MKKRMGKTAAILCGMLLLLLCYGLLTEQLGFGIPCIFFRLTGLRCPGCGNTHALRALLHGDLTGALRCNYLLPAEALYVGYLILNTACRYVKTGEYRLSAGSEAAGFVFVGVLLGWWVVRNLLGV